MCPRNGGSHLWGCRWAQGFALRLSPSVRAPTCPVQRAKGPGPEAGTPAARMTTMNRARAPLIQIYVQKNNSAAGKPHSCQSGSPLGQSVAGTVPSSVCTRRTDAGRRCMCPRPGLVCGPLHFCPRSCPLPHGLSSAPGLAHSPPTGFSSHNLASKRSLLPNVGKVQRAEGT